MLCWSLSYYLQDKHLSLRIRLTFKLSSLSYLLCLLAKAFACIIGATMGFGHHYSTNMPTEASFKKFKKKVKNKDQEFYNEESEAVRVAMAVYYVAQYATPQSTAQPHVHCNTMPHRYNIYLALCWQHLGDNFVEITLVYFWL